MTIQNALVDLGDAINMMNRETLEFLGFKNLRPIHTVLELADKFKI